MHPGTMLTDAVREWATPMASDALRSSGTYLRGNPTLPGQAKEWPTPVAATGPNRMQTTERCRNQGPNLGHTVYHWAERAAQQDFFPTPAANQYGTSQNEGKVEHKRPSNGTPSLETRARHGLLPSLHCPETSSAGEPTSRPSLILNPRFVEALMGWPVDWTRI